jgi:hypothetical protein
MSHEPQRDPVPPFAREVLALFASAFAEVRFPELDRAVLEGLAEELRAAQREVEQIEHGLAQARAQVALKAEALMALAQRGLAYARVFSEGDAELEEQVERVADCLAPAAGAAPKRRGRPRRAEQEASLFPGDGAHAGGHEALLDA